MTKPAITLVLTGFDIETRLVDNKVCGGFDGTFRTGARITVNKLNKDGFVTDNHEFISYVQEQFDGGPYKASCEELAEGVAKLVLEKVDKDRIVSIETVVHNLTGYAEFKWLHGMDAPRFPRKATKAEVRDSDSFDNGGPRGC